MLDADTFIFLNESRLITSKAIWNDPSIEKLWLYNLHYFDDLNALGAINRRVQHMQLIERWISENPPGHGNGWEPYPISLRIVNWIKWVLGGGILSPEATASLAIQTRFLCKRLEFHLLGNHLLANAKALIFAGAFFQQAEAQEWLVKGLKILHRELSEQVLGDGGHFERSPMYHAIILEDLLDIDNILQTYGLEAYINAAVVTRMRHFLSAMCHPDGEISFFNDSAFGIATCQLRLNEYAERLKHPAQIAAMDGIVHLVQSGYARLQKEQAVLILDAAPVGPNYLPGHAHADTLSFELSLFGQRLMVNSGTSCYGSGLERQRQRGTAAHNTLIIDGHDSSEVWDGFRVARRAHVQSLKITHIEDIFRVEASHDGYRRLSGRNLHHRTWRINSQSLVIEDQITGTFNQAEIRFHLHPTIEVLNINENEVSLKLHGGELATFKIEGARFSIEHTTWHPNFGIALPNICLVGTAVNHQIKTSIEWSLNA